MTKESEPLTEKERMVLEFEGQWWKQAPTKQEAIRTLGMSTAQYYLVLGRAMGKPAALFEYPELVRRLQRLRELRGAERHGSPGGGTR